MKRTIWLLIGLFMALTTSAQTQKGYVKTKGRLGNNGTVITGTRLSGVTVTVKDGNAVVSGNNGTFSLSIPTSRYYLQNVQKQGYILTDPDVLSKQYTWSKNPLVLVLEAPSQQADDKLAAEKKIRRTLQRQLQEKEDEIEALKEQQRLSEEEYRKKLQEIYAQQESNEKLISEMAERYSKIDFDEVDEFNRRISDCIINGRLTEADSLLNTKGDINTRATTLRQHQEANAQAEQELKLKQKKLEKSKAMTQKELEDLAQDCYSKFEIFKMQHQNDSATYYLELRAKLDTTNVEWQHETGRYIQMYLANYKLAEEYLKCSLYNCVKRYGNDNLNVANIHNSLGKLYLAQGNIEKSVSSYLEENRILELLYGKNDYRVAVSYNIIGNALYNQGWKRYQERATNYFEKSGKIWKTVINDDFDNISSFYHEYTAYLNNRGRHSSFEYSNHIYRLKSIVSNLIENTGEYNNLTISNCFNEIAILYSHIHKSDSALMYFKKALDINIKKMGENNHTVEAIYQSIATIYFSKQDYINARDIYEKLNKIKFVLYGELHPEVAWGYKRIGKTYEKAGDNENALTFYRKALVLQEAILGPSHQQTKDTRSDIEIIESGRANPKSIGTFAIDENGDVRIVFD